MPRSPGLRRATGSGVVVSFGARWVYIEEASFFGKCLSRSPRRCGRRINVAITARRGGPMSAMGMFQQLLPNAFLAN